MKKNIAIVGSSGYIATYIKNSFLMTDPTIRFITLDCINQPDLLLNLLKPNEFDYRVLREVNYVIFTAAISSPDKCAWDYKNCWQINVIGTEYFIQKALESGCKVLFFSSDAVFGEFSKGIAYEDTLTVAGSPYGYMKKHVEDQFRGEKNFKAIRLSYVVSKNDRFLAYCLRCAQDEKIAEIYHPFYRNCISVHDVVAVVAWLLHEWNNFPFQFLNVTGTELVSRVQMADELNCLINNRLKYVIIDPGDKFYNNRAKITHMGSLYLYEKKIIQRTSFLELLQKELEGVNVQ